VHWLNLFAKFSVTERTAGKPPSPASCRYFPVLAHTIPRLQTGASLTVIHTCITALHGLQINCATLKWLPSAGHNHEHMPLLSWQKLLEILVSMI